MLHTLADRDASTLLKRITKREAEAQSPVGVERTIVQMGEESKIIAENGTSVGVSYSICSKEGNAEFVVESSNSFTFDVDGGGVLSSLNDAVKGLTKGTMFRAE